jgi:hypothetical protein
MSQPLLRLQALCLIAFAIQPERGYALDAPAAATHFYWTESSVPFGGIRLRRSDTRGSNVSDLYVGARQSSGARNLAFDEPAGHLCCFIDEGD